MHEAVKEAQKALKHADVPIGAVIVKDGSVISRAHNKSELKSNSLFHAEMIALEKAIKKTGYKHLPECTLYVTLEPCAMCSGAAVLARIKRIVFGAYDPKAGACETLYNIPADIRLNHNCEITGGILQEECSKLLSNFFKIIRETKKNARKF